MRGVGKSFLGKSLGAELDWPCLDLDVLLQQAAGKSCTAIVRDEGWSAFRARETALLQDVLRSHPTGAVIACGGGVVETAAARECLARHAPVVHVERSIVDISGELAEKRRGSETRDQGAGSRGGSSTGHRPAYAKGETLEQAWARRRPWFEQVSTHHFFVVPGDQDWKHIRRDFVHFIATIGAGPLTLHASAAVPRALQRLHASEDAVACGDVVMKPAPGSCVMPRLRPPLLRGTFFVCLTYKDLRPVLPKLHVVCESVDAVELRVDLLASTQPEFVVRQVSLLRRAVGHLPIIFTVRSVAHGGSFAGSRAEQLQLLTMGARVGCAYVDVEAHDDEFVRHVHRVRGAARIISSVHLTSAPVPSADALTRIFTQAHCGGLADVVKVVVPCATLAECFRLRSVADHAETLFGPGCGVIAIGTGERAKITRVVNTTLTPVTHDLLPRPAASGQLTARDIQQLRVDQGLLTKRHYFLFGHPVRSSPSRVLHSTGFRVLHLPHTYATPASARVVTDDDTQLSWCFGVPCVAKHGIGQCSQCVFVRLVGLCLSLSRCVCICGLQVRPDGHSVAEDRRRPVCAASVDLRRCLHHDSSQAGNCRVPGCLDALCACHWCGKHSDSAWQHPDW